MARKRTRFSSQGKKHDYGEDRFIHPVHFEAEANARAILLVNVPEHLHVAFLCTVLLQWGLFLGVVSQPLQVAADC